MKKKNVVLISADQLRKDFLGRGFTPNIDALMNESIVYDSCYCNSPLCVPARGAMLTGTYPSTNGSLINPWQPPDIRYGLVREGIENIYGIMEGLGYECIHTGKQHLYTENGNIETRPEEYHTRFLTTEKTYKAWLKENGYPRPGGKVYRTTVPKLVEGRYTVAKGNSNGRSGIYSGPENAYFDIYFTDQLLEHIDERDREKPLFLSCMYLAPHPPFCIPERYFNMYRNEDIPIQGNTGTWSPLQSPLQLYQITGSIGNSFTRDEWQETWRVYAGLCTLLDDQVKRVIDYLKKEGIYDDSVIIFTSDHGEMLGDHQLFQKMCMYQEVVNVPLSIRIPGVEGRKVDTLTTHIDLLPTLMDILGEESLSQFQGESLLGEKREKLAYIQFDGTDELGNFSRAVTDGRMKLVMDIFKDEIFPELYDTEKDPEETENLAFNREYWPLFNEMLGHLENHMKESGDFLEIAGFDIEKTIGVYNHAMGKQTDN